MIRNGRPGSQKGLSACLPVHWRVEGCTTRLVCIFVDEFFISGEHQAVVFCDVNVLVQ